jgi:LysM repeat protein
MNQRSSAPARIFAVAALVAALVLAIVVIGGGFGGDSSDSGEHGHSSKRAAHRAAGGKQGVPATYVIKSGDTLLAIAHRIGVPVARIQALNPQVDPQILIAGEELKLK